MSLFIKTSGKGDVICFLHGWALNGSVWDPVVEQLSQNHLIMAVDLPGHGKSSPLINQEYTVDILADCVYQKMKPETILVGWSLGGLIALRIAASYPHLIRKLILVASSPQFANTESWEHGVKKAVIDGFATELTTKYRETIHRFLAIQTFGSEKAKPVIRELKDKVFANGEPHMESLSRGLEILKNANLWEAARNIRCPTLIVLGEKDTLIPRTSGEKTQNAITGSRLEIIKGAGHAPFISHPDEFLKIIRPFISE